MSRVQPPGRLPSLGGSPFGAKTPGCGHVRAPAGMYASMLNGWLVKWLVKVVPVVESVQSGPGADTRFTSFCIKQVYAGGGDVLLCITWVVCAASAAARPFTPSQPP